MGVESDRARCGHTFRGLDPARPVARLAALAVEVEGELAERDRYLSVSQAPRSASKPWKAIARCSPVSGQMQDLVLGGDRSFNAPAEPRCFLLNVSTSYQRASCRYTADCFSGSAEGLAGNLPDRFRITASRRANGKQAILWLVRFLIRPAQSFSGSRTAHHRQQVLGGPGPPRLRSSASPCLEMRRVKSIAPRKPARRGVSPA